MIKKKVKKFSGENGSYVLPAQVRTFAETVAGKRDPITEKNFNPEELDQMRDAIMRSRKREEKLNQSVYNQQSKRKIKETVDYGDYGDDAKRQKSTLRDFSPLPSDAARNTLGRFKYEKTPEGKLIATDSYDFKDDLVKENNKVPRSKDYEQLSALEKVGKIAKDTLNPKIGVSTLPSRIGSAFVGASSRPVRIDLGDAPFKKGGKVKPKTASSRADGIAQRGKTRGRMR
jgi:hypothetical protein